MIELKQLSKYFGEHPVVQNASAEFEKAKLRPLLVQMEPVKVPYYRWQDAY